MASVYVASRDTSSGTAPKASGVKRGKASMSRATARPPCSSSSPQTAPLSIQGPRQLGWLQRLPPLELVGTRPPQKRLLRRLDLLRLKRLRRMTTTCTFACRGRRWRQWISCSPRRYSTRFPKALSHRMQHQLSTRSGAAAGARVTAVSWRIQHHLFRACRGCAVWQMW